MDIAPFMAELRSRDVRLWAEGDRLRCDAPPGVLTEQLRGALRTHKSALLEFLRSAAELDARSRQLRALVPLQSRGHRPPLFAVGGHNGDVFCYRALAQCLGEERPFFGLQPPGADGQGEPLERVEELAAYFAEQIRLFHPQGPCLLLGFCAGGTIAFDLARQLRRSGRQVGLLALIASPHPYEFRLVPTLLREGREQWRRLFMHGAALMQPWREQREHWQAVMARRQARYAEEAQVQRDPLLASRARLERITLGALARYQPRTAPGAVHLLLPDARWIEWGGLARRWRGLAERMEEHFGPAGSDGDDILREVHAPAVAETLREILAGSAPGRCG